MPCDRPQAQTAAHPRPARASVDPAPITGWWRKWPAALIGVSAGIKSRVICLDVDVKKADQNGFDTLERLGLRIPETPTQHTASGGVHHLFDPGDVRIRTTTGVLGRRRGADGKWISGGLDVRSDGGHFIAAAPGSGYSWDPFLNLDTLPLAPAPLWLNPPEPVIIRPPKSVRPCTGLSPYAEGAIARACKAIRTAGDGTQRDTLVKQSFSIGTLAASGGIPADYARRMLIAAGCDMVSYNPADRWTVKEIERVVNGCFAGGMAHPRPTVGRTGR